MAKRRSEADRRARQCQRLGRVLRLLCLIQERHGRWNLDTLARELDCSRKTIQRDLLVLQDAGIPYLWDELEGCYRVRPDFRLPMLSGPTPGTTQDISEHHAPEDSLSGSSPEAAARLLSEAERLAATLGHFCQALRRSGITTELDGPGGEIDAG